MKFSLMVIYSILFSCVFVGSSCVGQDATDDQKQSSKTPQKPTSIGEVALELDKRTTVIYQDRNGHHWFGGGESGVFRFDGESLVRFSTQDGLCSHSVLGIQEDRDGNIYFDTLEGVSKFDGQKFTTLEVVKSDSPKNEWQLEPDDLWFRIGWEGKGPYRYDGESLYQLEFPENKRADEFHAKFPNASWSPYGIYTLYQDSSGTVWFGTAALGVCRYDGTSIDWLFERQLTETPGGGDFGIRSIIEDENGYFWFCNTRFRYEMLPGDTDKAQINYRRENGVGYSKTDTEVEFPYFMSIAKDDEGDLWMATYDDGIWRNDGKKLVHYPVKVGDKGVLAFSIYKDKQGVLWLGTHNAGTFKFNGNEFEQFLMHR